MSDGVSQSQSKIARKQQNRAKLKNDCSSENIFTLITLVEERPSLWDKGLPEYKLPTTLAWQEISDVIGNCTGQECKAKWNNLRVTFNTNLAKFRSSKSGQSTDEKRPITWKYFQSMLFLEATNVRQSSKSVSSMELPSAVTDDSIMTDLGMSATVSELSTSGKPRPVTTTKRPTPSPSLSPDYCSFKQLAAQALSRIGSQPRKDENTAFSEFVAAELHTLLPDRAAYVRRKLISTFIDLVNQVEMTPSPVSSRRTSREENNYVFVNEVGLARIIHPTIPPPELGADGEPGGSPDMQFELSMLDSGRDGGLSRK